MRKGKRKQLSFDLARPTTNGSNWTMKWLTLGSPQGGEKDDDDDTERAEMETLLHKKASLLVVMTARVMMI